MQIIAHGGVGGTREQDGCVEEALEKGSKGTETPLEAVVGVVRELEDDPIFNAGTGSRIRLDGTIQMDAAVMTPEDIGSIAAVERVRNPILVALEVYHSPYVFLAGADVTRFARKLGYEDYDPSTEKREKELAEMKNKLKGDDKELDDLRNFYRKVGFGDTVGCVAAEDGNYAAAVSTGGTDYCIRGRVGDSPVPGAGFFVGEHGAVVTTGKGEEIIKRMTAIRCHDMIPEYGIKEACRIGVENLPEDTTLGIIAVGEEGPWADSSREMPQAKKL